MRLGLPEYDLRQRIVVDGVKQQILIAHRHGSEIMLWISLPCTAWSTWQYINMHADEMTAYKIKQARRESKQMMRHVTRMLGDLWDAGVRFAVAFEWPRNAIGWKERSMQRLLSWLPFEALPDGCQYGVVDVSNLPLKNLGESAPTWHVLYQLFRDNVMDSVSTLSVAVLVQLLQVSTRGHWLAPLARQC